MDFRRMLRSITFFLLSRFFLVALLSFVGLDRFQYNQDSTATQVKDSSDQDRVVKVFFGPKKVLFCFPSEYVTGVGQLYDGSWRAEIVMFLPDLSTEAVYDKLHPIPPSPIFWSPDRIAYSHSILQIEVTSSYLGPNDPTGELSFNKGTKNFEQGDSLSNKFPVAGFKEYEDASGSSPLYVYNGAEPYAITCYAQFCGLDEILNHSLLVDISLDKSAIPRSLFILDRFNHIVASTNCPK